MGATSFYNKVKGEHEHELFKQAVNDACYEHGNEGYTGTIAEKDGYTMSKKPSDFDTDVWIEMVEDFDGSDKEQKHYKELRHDYKIYDDKWGNALCIPYDGGFVFCGMASD
mgnify:CR=1 FL=1